MNHPNRRVAAQDLSRRVMLAASTVLAVAGQTAFAEPSAAGPPVVRSSSLLSRLDAFDEREDSGLRSRSNQKRLDAAVIVGMFGTALWQGSGTPLGGASWKAIDATLTTALTTELMKNVFTRPRPSQDPDPSNWFAGRGHKSFPSGETALMAAFVTPYILHYREETPLAWGLLALPLYMGSARMASQGHWLTDVVAGAAIGFGMGVLADRREHPLVLSVTGDGVFVGWKQKF